jgi:hypothetical protein
MINTLFFNLETRKILICFYKISNSLKVENSYIFILFCAEILILNLFFRAFKKYYTANR